MSTETYDHPNGKTYDIGYEGLEHSRTGILGFIADIFRATYPGLPIISALAVAVLDWNGESVCPTYGSWAGSGWSGGKRSSVIDWETLPCYNENVINSSNPESCYSLVDAIAKAHDWRYDQAAKTYVKGSADYANAIKNSRWFNHSD